MVFYLLCSLLPSYSSSESILDTGKVLKCRTSQVLAIVYVLPYCRGFTKRIPRREVFQRNELWTMMLTRVACVTVISVE